MANRDSKLTRVERTTDSGTKYLEKVRAEDVNKKPSPDDDAVVTSAKTTAAQRKS